MEHMSKDDLKRVSETMWQDGAAPAPQAAAPSASLEELNAIWRKAAEHPDGYDSLTPEEREKIMEWEFSHQH